MDTESLIDAEKSLESKKRELYGEPLAVYMFVDPCAPVREHRTRKVDPWLTAESHQNGD